MESGGWIALLGGGAIGRKSGTGSGEQGTGSRLFRGTRGALPATRVTGKNPPRGFP